MSRFIEMKACIALLIMKETSLIMAEALENVLFSDPEREEEQNKTGIAVLIPKESELGAEKDPVKVNHGDGNSADATVITIPLL